MDLLSDMQFISGSVGPTAFLRPSLMVQDLFLQRCTKFILLKRNFKKAQGARFGPSEPRG